MGTFKTQLVDDLEVQFLDLLNLSKILLYKVQMVFNGVMIIYPDITSNKRII